MRNLADRLRVRKLPKFILMTDAARLPRPLATIRALPKGSAVIFRHYDHPRRETLARQVVSACRERGVPVLIAGDARLARALNADGVHLPEGLARANPGVWRPHLRRGMWVSAAAHSLRALQRAVDIGADFALLSPVFPTQSHPGGRAIGLQRFAGWGRQASIPVYGLGGITSDNQQQVFNAGAAGWAGISGFKGKSNST